MQYRPAKIYPLDALKNEQDELYASGKITHDEYQKNCAAIPLKAMAVRKWYVHYSFVHPFSGKYERFKVYEDINLYKGEDKVEYARNLRDAVNLSLRNGYSPFDEEEKLETWLEETEVSRKAEDAGDRSRWSLIRGLNLFLETKKEAGKSTSTLSAYKTTCDFIKNWLNDNGMLLTPASNITAVQYTSILTEESRKKQWANKTYNNYLLFTETMLNWLADEKNGPVIPKNPIKGAEQREVLDNKPSYYTDEDLRRILELVRSRKDVYMEGIILTCYYAAVRSKAEMRAFQAKNILFDRDLLLLSADGTKARREDYIPLDPVLKAFYLKHGFDRLPPEWYIFGNENRPGPHKASSNHYATLYKPYRQALNIDEALKIYNWKHTRAIHMAAEGKNPYAIMQLFRHTSLEQTMVYLRSLGIIINREGVENSRVI